MRERGKGRGCEGISELLKLGDFPATVLERSSIECSCIVYECVCAMFNYVTK